MGLVQIGQQLDASGSQIGGNLVSLEGARNAENAQAKTGRKNSQLSGAATGAGIGTAILPGWGTAIGAVGGFLAASFL